MYPTVMPFGRPRPNSIFEFFMARGLRVGNLKHPFRKLYESFSKELLRMKLKFLLLSCTVKFFLKGKSFELQDCLNSVLFNCENLLIL